jgi:hypothetical protein
MTMQTIYRARVVRKEGDDIYIEVPKLSPRYELGPVEYPWNADLRPGDKVIVGMVENAMNDIVILNVLGRPSGIYNGGDLDETVVGRIFSGGSPLDHSITGVIDGGSPLDKTPKQPSEIETTTPNVDD